MPADFEYDIDHKMVDIAAWDHVSIDDLLSCFQRLATLPGNLTDSIQYLDLSEAKAIAISSTGAMQLGAAYEDLLDRGLRGMVIFAPDEDVAGTAGMIMSTLADLIGSFPDGFYVIRAAMPASDVKNCLAKKEPPGEGKGVALSS